MMVKIEKFITTTTTTITPSGGFWADTEKEHYDKHHEIRHGQQGALQRGRQQAIVFSICLLAS